MSDEPLMTTGPQEPFVSPEVDSLCDQFEAAWKAAGPEGPSPSIEDFLAGRGGAEQLALLQELVALDIVYRRQRGEAPGADTYRQRFPGLDALWLEAEVERQMAPRPAKPAAPPPA